MKRRKFISVAAVSIPLSGCLGDSDDPTDSKSSAQTPNETEHSSNTPTESEKSSSEGATPECHPSMCEGTRLVEASVAEGFSGDVVLKPDCRNEEFSIQSGESVEIVRNEDAEKCRISLSVDDEQKFNELIEGYERVNLTINSDGKVSEDWVVY